MGMRTIAEISELIRQREVSPLALTRECLDRIVELNPKLNAFITVTADSALQEARLAEKGILAGSWRGALHGVPIGLKDLIDTAGVRTTAASAAFGNRIPAEDADVVLKLRSAGAIFLGKQNLHEFAYGGSSLVSCFGPVRNPVNPDFIAGGSSGGSAAAVASGMCYAAVGTDTAGSIREPAALCGVVGLKPSYGLVSTRGIIPLSVSLDHAGPIARCVEDAAIMLDALSGSGSQYHSGVQLELKPFRFGVPRKFFCEDLDDAVERALNEAISRIEQLGGRSREIEIAVPTDRTVQAYESFAYHRNKLGSFELYDPETLRRIRTGENITNEQYESALRELERARSAIAAAFHEVDFLITPTTPAAAPKISDLLQDPSLLRPAELRLLRNTRPVNVWGLPAISVPCGKTSEGMPIGLQIIGSPNTDASVLQLAYRFEKVRGQTT